MTLRDGEQAVDVAYNDQEKVDILWALSDAGVKRAQIGFTGRDESVATAAKSAGVPIDLELMTVLTNQNWRSELSLARDIGVDSVNLLIRSSDDMIRLLGLDRSSVAALAVEATKFARELGFQHVVFGPSFVTQADPSFCSAFTSPPAPCKTGYWAITGRSCPPKRQPVENAPRPSALESRWGRFSAGDHALVVLRINELRIHSDVDPIVFHRSGLHRLHRESA